MLTVGLLILSTVFLLSCKRTSCSPIVIGGGYIHDTVLVDSFVDVIRCEKSSDFSNKIDSFRLTITPIPDRRPLVGIVSYRFSDASKDYILIFRPTGTTYKLGDIEYGHEKYYLRNEHVSTCSYSYRLNGKLEGAGMNEIEPPNGYSGIVLLDF